MDINSLKDNLNKSLADVSTKGIPSANFEPVWINNITRLNAQNFNACMYPTIASYITGYGNAVFEGSNEQLSNLLSILPGYKVTDTSTSEIHNLNSDLSSTNEADGAYQAVFGIGNITNTSVDGQFILGKYNTISDNFIFAIGNGTNETNRSNAFEVSNSGEIKVSNIAVTEGIVTAYVKITTAITDTSDDTYAATKKYVFDKVKEESERAQEVENNKQDKFAKYIADPSATQGILTSITKQLDIRSGDGSYGVAIAPDVVGLYSSDPLGASLYIHSTTARFGSPSSTGIPVLGIATPVNTSTSGVTTEDIPYQAVNKEYVDTNFQAKLVSGTNIKSIKDDKTEAQSLLGSDSLSFKTINNQSLLGSGNITIEGGGGTSITVDAELSTTSTNPVQNKVITTELNGKQPLITNTSDITLSELHAKNLYASSNILVQDIQIKRTTNGALAFSRQIDQGYGPVELANIAEGTDAHSAVNLNQLNGKQNKFATLNSTNNSIELDTTYESITGNGSSIIFTDTTNDLRVTSAGNIELNANKDVYISSTNPTVRSDYYNIAWDSTNEAIKITFHE